MRAEMKVALLRLEVFGRMALRATRAALLRIENIVADVLVVICSSCEFMVSNIRKVGEVGV